MNFNYKLLTKYLLQSSPQLFLQYRHTPNYIYIITSALTIYYLLLHIKLTTCALSAQLIDMFTYELPTITPPTIYHFQTLITAHRLFFFSVTRPLVAPPSITELFLNANWLEREISELHGLFFAFKRDLRNLLLPYNDCSAPMEKITPSVGLIEYIYDVYTDTLIAIPISLQY